MTKNIIIIVLFISFQTFVMGQKDINNVVISGKIIESEANQPLEYATISFFNSAENRLKGGGITDIDGNFSISIPKGIYDFYVEYFSFKNITKLRMNLNQDRDLGVLKMEANLQILDAVDIIAEQTTVEIKLDKKIYNVGKDLTVRGGSISDVLDNVPSVSVDLEGNVAL
ncbi:MAG: carboxypeptidase-like regulatory domain-containing protein, partial [Flavobacteriaceae bacterium]|nr:carboxypeptidase-like regulatory domain-containing protein [Flavobacteriaceae bacterium]